MIHPTALVHPEAKIDPSTEIGPYCVIGPQVRLGRGNRLHSHVVIDGNTEIGEENQFFPFAVIGAVPQDLKYKGENTRLVIGNKNTFRESVTVNLGTIQGGGETRIGSNNLLMATVHIGHDSILGNHIILANGCAVAGHVTIADFANIGGMSGVSQFTRVGSYCYAAGQSGIDRDVPPYSIVMGTRPCVVKGVNIVGLRRRGFAAETITRVNEAMKLWMRQDVEKNQCLADIEAQFGDVPEVAILLEFIRSSSSGVIR